MFILSTKAAQKKLFILNTVSNFQDKFYLKK